MVTLYKIIGFCLRTSDSFTIQCLRLIILLFYRFIHGQLLVCNAKPLTHTKSECAEMKMNCYCFSSLLAVSRHKTQTIPFNCDAFVVVQIPSDRHFDCTANVRVHECMCVVNVCFMLQCLISCQSVVCRDHDSMFSPFSLEFDVN